MTSYSPCLKFFLVSPLFLFFQPHHHHFFYPSHPVSLVIPLLGVPWEEVDALSPDCIENSRKRHEEKSLNHSNWLLFPLSSSCTTIDDCLRGLGPDSVWLADCSCSAAQGPVNVALWEVPLCALPPVKSSFPRERGAELECKSKARVGPQETKGTHSQAARPLWMCVFANNCNIKY